MSSYLKEITNEHVNFIVNFLNFNQDSGKKYKSGCDSLDIEYLWDSNTKQVWFQCFWTDAIHTKLFFLAVLLFPHGD